MIEKNKLYFADCLEILRKIHKENPKGIFDLIYIDPPFNSKRNYNVLFESADIPDATAQKEAFKDTWSNISYIDTINEIQDLSLDLYEYLKVLDKIKISKSAVSYLTIMAIRLYYIHKVLKDTGSFYLHCDPNMSHYLKTICDLIFGYSNFRNEIIWHYRRWTNVQRQFQKMHDIILFYSKTSKSFFKSIEVDMSKSQLKKFNRGYDTNVIHIKNKKVKQIIVYNEEKLKKSKIILGKYDNVVHKSTSKVSEADVWNIPILNSQARERLGYPTQKPEALLERIIKASSNENDLVGDFFCGCGTTVAVAQRLNRRWLGVDISHQAIKLIRKRLIDPYKLLPQKRKEILDNIIIDGFPLDLASAKELAENVNKGRIRFQDWIIEVMLGGVSSEKKTADGGFDGYISFTFRKKKQLALIEVKSGKVGIRNMREFIQVIQKRKADIGVFICFEEHVTKGMEKEAKECGYYNEEIFNKRHPRLQILSVHQILKGELISIPFESANTFKSAAKAKLQPDGEQKSF